MSGVLKMRRRAKHPVFNPIPGVAPFFQRAGVCLYHGEALSLLRKVPTAIAAAAILDPPYSSGGLTSGERGKDPREKYCHGGNDCGRPSFGGDNRDQRSFRFWSTLWTNELARIVRSSGYCLVFTDWRQLSTMTDVMQAGGFVWRGLVPWNKGRGARAPHKGYFRHQCEYVVWGTNGACRKATHAGPFEGCITETVRKADKFHMVGKPTKVMQDLVQCVEPGQLVIDPFSGSSTTGVACVREGRSFIGFEQSIEYCRISAERFETELAGQPASRAA